jgi:hypothetical protein
VVFLTYYNKTVFKKRKDCKGMSVTSSFTHSLTQAIIPLACFFKSSGSIIFLLTAIYSQPLRQDGAKAIWI